MKPDLLAHHAKEYFSQFKGPEGCNIMARVAAKVAVGTMITHRPPHRSVRAVLPHTAPTLDGWRKIALLDKDVESLP